MNNKPFAVFVAVVLLCVTATPSMAIREKTIPYDPDFIQLLSQGWIRHVEIVKVSSGETYLRAKLTSADGKEQETIRVNVVVNDGLLEMLRAGNVKYEFIQEDQFTFQEFLQLFPFFMNWILWIVMIIIFARLVRAVELIARNIKKE